MEKKDMTLEERMAELNDIIKEMEKSDISLEKSFQLYKTGVTRLNECTQMIDNIEKELIVLEEGQEE